MQAWVMQARLPAIVFYLAICLIAFGFPATQAWAEIYKWVDSRGNLHFTETRPTGGEYQEVRPQAAPGDPNAPKQLEEQIQQQGAQDEVQRVEAEEAERIASQRAAKQINCERANDMLASFQNRPYRTAVRDSSGEYVRLSPEEYDAKLAKLRSQAAEYCSE